MNIKMNFTGKSKLNDDEFISATIGSSINFISPSAFILIEKLKIVINKAMII